jgi:hypothetical protein
MLGSRTFLSPSASGRETEQPEVHNILHGSGGRRDQTCAVVGVISLRVLAGRLVLSTASRMIVKEAPPRSSLTNFASFINWRGGPSGRR